MTTIVIDATFRKIVVDRRYTHVNSKFKPSKLLSASSPFVKSKTYWNGPSKMRRMKDGSVFVGTGSCRTIYAAYDALEKGKQPKIKDNTAVYVIRPQYPFEVDTYEKSGKSTTKDWNWITSGSGKDSAAAIMLEHTKNQNRAVRAIQVASEFDNGTSPEVDVMEFPLYDDLH